jgi:hypothetical protein
MRYASRGTLSRPGVAPFKAQHDLSRKASSTGFSTGALPESTRFLRKIDKFLMSFASAWTVEPAIASTRLAGQLY